ncbi:dehydrogenase [Klebsormidium nitens]|uniref:Dehydrogenase n=1 Tax=Klebsormidium nitens TaxID=105231 RepID=A0A1Y1I5N0_KLENI|nr:dehydrogenase [Klebsormidium nitens]|eukprot:GAQ86264.1 dehydrogenase [Klebsormidium nitens]
MGSSEDKEQLVNLKKRLDGKVAIVTGANSGLGKETAKFLAGEGASVILGCRSADRGLEAAADIREAVPGADVEAMLLDLRTLASIRDFATKFKEKKRPLHILVNNAGAVLSREWYTEQGVGGSAQVNFLGPYMLTRLLEDELTQGAPSKVVNVSSVMHRMASITSADKFLRDFKHGNYTNTKLANVLFTHELQRRWGGKAIESSAVDPGSVYTRVWRGSVWDRPPGSWLLKSIYGPPEDGAIAVNHAAVAPNRKVRPWKPSLGGPDAEGRFFAKGFFASKLLTAHPLSSSFPGLAPLERAVLTAPIALVLSSLDWPVRWISRGRFNGEVREVRPAPTSRDRALAKELWEEAEKIAGLAEVEPQSAQ